MLAVNPSCTCEEVVLKYSVIAGNVGKYISVTNGPKAVSTPRNTRINNCEFSFAINIILNNATKLDILKDIAFVIIRINYFINGNSHGTFTTQYIV